MDMLAVVKYGNNKGEMELRQVPVPEIGDGDVLLKVKAAGLCGSDINSWKGLIKSNSLPRIPGHEFAGEIAAVGKRVKTWKPGDRVVSDISGYVCGRCHACIKGEFLECENRLNLGITMNGGFAEYVKIEEEVLMRHSMCLMHIPNSMSFEEGAIMDPVANGYTAAIIQGNLQLGENVVVLGVGPLGLNCIAAASLGGAAAVIAVARSSTSKKHREAAKAMGAAHIIESDTGDPIKEIMDITGGEGVPLILDSAGSNSLFPLCVACTWTGGKIVKIGYDFDSLDHSLFEMIEKNISLVGHMGFNPTAWKYGLRLVGSGRWNIKQIITHKLPLRDFNEGVKLLLNREAIKVVYSLTS
jgi:threonine dehydrogenase-like Zn-dependent dehydrogenase